MLFNEKIFRLKNEQISPIKKSLSKYEIINERSFDDIFNDISNAFEIENRKIDKTKINDDVEVSTVFLCIKHPDNNLFETMIFGGKFNGKIIRYKTLEQAKNGHKKIVEKLKRSYDGKAKV